MAAKKAGMATGVEVARISVKVSPDTDKFRSELKEELEAIERTMKGHVEVKAHLDGAQARADFERLKSAMQKSGRVRIGVDMVPDAKKVGGGDGNDPSKKLGKDGKGGKFPFPSFGTGINPAGYAVILAGITAVAAPLFGLITTSLLAIPGLLSLITAPIAAITLGLDGFKKAAEVIKPQFDDLKKSMSEAAQTEFTPVLQRVADEIFPKLKESLPAVTKGLADFSQGALDAFKNDGGKFQASIERIGAFFSQMRPGMDGFMSGLIGLIDNFTLQLPDIADWFNKSGEGFNNWVKEITAGGKDSKLSVAFEQLGKTIDTVLSKVADWGKAAVNFMGTPGSMDGFIETLGKIGDLITDIINLSAKLNESWQTVVQGGRFIGALGKLTQGDLMGAWSNAKDLFNNTPWLQNATEAQPSKAQIDALNKSIMETEQQAIKSQQAVSTLLGGPEQAPIQGPGLGHWPVDVTGSALQPGAAAAAPQENKVPVPDTSEATAAINTYKADVQSAMNETKTAVESATSNVKAPDFSSISSSLEEIPGKAQEAMGQLASNITSGGAAAVTAANEVGLQIASGMAAGILKGAPVIELAARSAAVKALNAAKDELGVSSPSREFMKIGGYTAQGMAVGMENGFGPVIAQARELAGKVADAFASGGDPTGALQGFGDTEVSRMEKVLSFEAKRLGIQAKALEYQAKSTGNGALKAKAEELRMQQQELVNQKDMLDLTQEYADLQNPSGGKTSSNPFLASIQELMKMPNAFAQATAGQAMQDLGMSGDGALQAVAGWGMDFAKKGVTNIFNTSNVDDTISIHNNQTNKQAQGMVGR